MAGQASRRSTGSRKSLENTAASKRGLDGGAADPVSAKSIKVQPADGTEGEHDGEALPR